MGVITYLYLILVVLTSRIRLSSESPESLRLVREKRPVVYTFWFQHIIILIDYFAKKEYGILMTPHNGKSDALTRLSELLRYRVARGSFEGGGRHGLLNLMDVIKRGKSVLIPADGSMGPEKKCKARPLIVAQDRECPIIPVTWRSALRIKWPRKYGPLYIPLPMSFIEIKLGTPITIPKHYTKLEELDGIKDQITRQLTQLSTL